MGFPWGLGGVFVLSAGLTWMVRQAAVHWSIYDEPVGRSSHSVPTPRLGGVAIAGSALAGWALVSAESFSVTTLAVIAGGLIAALTGLIDDILGLSPLTKLSSQVLAVASPFVILGLTGDGLLTWIGASVCATLLLIYMNFFNFMDGTDGMAAGVAVLTAVGLAGLAWQAEEPRVAEFSVVVGMAAGGFLLYNYPPASIFMGDAGSLFLGYALGLFSALLVLSGVSPLAVLIVLAPFVVDASVTLARRAVAREVVWHAHRSHLYQRLVSHGVSHARVSLIYYGWPYWPRAWHGALPLRQRRCIRCSLLLLSRRVSGWFVQRAGLSVTVMLVKQD